VCEHRGRRRRNADGSAVNCDDQLVVIDVGSYERAP
jgi:hypothetical protein